MLKRVGLQLGFRTDPIVVALATYAKKYNDKILKDFAWDLYEDVFNNITSDMPIGIESGLAGIGYGTTLLKQLDFVNCDLNDILPDVDKKIMEHDPRRIPDLTFHNGLYGIMCYIAFREKIEGGISTFDEQYIQELRYRMSNQYDKSSYQNMNILEFLHEPEFEMTEYVDHPLCLDGGSSYFILKDSAANFD